jgi:Zn-dependent protease with chaperone function
MEFKAFYFDGKTSEKKEVQVHFYDIGELRIKGLENELSFRLKDIRITPRIANTPRSLYFPDGAKCETQDNDTIDAFLSQQKKGRWNAFQHKVESNLEYVFPALVFSVLIIWGLLYYGLPVLSKKVAFALPSSVQASLGKEGLQYMDKLLFAPSDLPEEKQEHLRLLFNNTKQGIPKEYDFLLALRKSPKLGANAFALPSGIVVVTDKLVQLAKNDNELIGIFAHEMGHVVHRHALRNLLQDSAIVLVIAGITGDISSVSSLAAGLPVILVQRKYSRSFEREADLFAMKYMKQHKIPPRHLADILLRLQEQRKTGNGLDYLSTHPATEKRVKELKGEE